MSKKHIIVNFIIQKLKNKHISLKKYTDWATLGHVTQNLEFWFQCRKCAPKPNYFKKQHFFWKIFRFFVLIRLSQGLTLPLKSQEPGFSTFPCPFHVCKHFSNLEDPPKNCNYQMKLYMVVYMCLLDLTFETCDLSQGQVDSHFYIQLVF